MGKNKCSISSIHDAGFTTGQTCTHDFKELKKLHLAFLATSESWNRVPQKSPTHRPPKEDGHFKEMPWYAGHSALEALDSLNEMNRPADAFFVRRTRVRRLSKVSGIPSNLVAMPFAPRETAFV